MHEKFKKRIEKEQKIAYYKEKLEELLKKRPEYKPLQEEIESRLKKVEVEGNPQRTAINRSALAFSLMKEKAFELQEKLKELLGGS